ncbi:MAG TPA: DNA primase [Candidatus Bathyarchaeia archaeon]|nr:DNA primase [Candidatus Bathyarchaeia archaeon]
MDQLDEIRQKVNLVDLVGEYVTLKKAGRNFKALCPFHSEAQPSFIVSPERQIWKCFGCAKGGDAFHFLTEIEGMDFGEAVRLLAKRVGVELKPFRSSQGEQQKQLFYEINHLAAEFYHYLLTKHPAGKKALDYILGRGISQESISLFKLGYSPNMWDGVQKYLVKKKNYRSSDLEAVGLIIRGGRSGFYDRFRNRLMFPLRDHQGNTCGFAGRVLEKEAKEAKYVNSPETRLYHKSRLLYDLWLTRSEIKKTAVVVLVEGELDAISSYQTGVRNVLAIKGSALTEEQLVLLKRYSQNLILALDGDVAGDAAARRGIELADNLGFSIKVVQIKGGKDPDEVAQKDPVLWRQLVAEAVPIYDYFLSSALSRFDARSAEGKRKIGQEFIPVLVKISDNIVRGHYIGLLAARLGVGEEVIIKEIERFSQKPTRQAITAAVFPPADKNRLQVLEEYLLALCLQSGKWKFLTKRVLKNLIVTPALSQIMETIGVYLKKFKTLKSDRLAKMLPPELLEIFNQLYLYDLGDWTDEKEKMESEIKKMIKEIERVKIKQRFGQLTREIKEIEKQKRDRTAEDDSEIRKKLARLNEEFRDLSTKLGEI